MSMLAILFSVQLISSVVLANPFSQNLPFASRNTAQQLSSAQVQMPSGTRARCGENPLTLIVRLIGFKKGKIELYQPPPPPNISNIFF